MTPTITLQSAPAQARNHRESELPVYQQARGSSTPSLSTCMLDTSPNRDFADPSMLEPSV